MGETEDDVDPLPNDNSTNTEPTRSRPTTRWYVNGTPPTTTTYFFIPKRPQVVKMRDLSPATKERLYREYYEVYDPWTGIRIAATLGILISLFTLFLIYKGRYNKTRTNIVPTKKPSLYLYDEDLDCDLGNVGSSDDSGSFGYPFKYEDTRLQREFPFGLNEEYPLEEVFVKSSVVECVALTVHKNHKGVKGPKYGTLRIKEDASRSLPCSPYKQKTRKISTEEDNGVDTDAKSPCSPTSPQEGCSSVFGSITSFSSSEVSNDLAKPTVFSKPKQKANKGEAGAKSAKKSDTRKTNDCEGGSDESMPTNTVVVASKRPQDYRSRSTVVAIGRRKKKT